MTGSFAAARNIAGSPHNRRREIRLCLSIPETANHLRRRAPEFLESTRISWPASRHSIDDFLHADAGPADLRAHCSFRRAQYLGYLRSFPAVDIPQDDSEPFFFGQCVEGFPKHLPFLLFGKA